MCACVWVRTCVHARVCISLSKCIACWVFGHHLQDRIVSTKHRRLCFHVWLVWRVLLDACMLCYLFHTSAMIIATNSLGLCSMNFSKSDVCMVHPKWHARASRKWWSRWCMWFHSMLCTHTYGCGKWVNVFGLWAEHVVLSDDMVKWCAVPHPGVRIVAWSILVHAFVTIVDLLAGLRFQYFNSLVRKI